MAIRYNSKMKISSILGTTIGVAICLLLWIIISVILTSLVLNETILYQSLNWLLPFTQCAISFLGAYIAGAIVNERKSMSSMICGGIYLGAITCFTLLFSDGVYYGNLMGASGVAVGCIAAALVHLKKKKVSPRKRGSNRFR